MKDRFDILRRIRAEFGSEVAAVTMIDVLDGMFSHTASTAFSDTLETFETLRTTNTCCAKVIDSAAFVAISEVSLASGDTRCPMMTAEGFEAYLGVPLFVNEEVVGALEVIASAPRHWRKDEIALLERFARIFETQLDGNRAADNVIKLRQVR